jgi:hypothetical protein
LCALRDGTEDEGDAEREPGDGYGKIGGAIHVELFIK